MGIGRQWMIWNFLLLLCFVPELKPQTTLSPTTRATTTASPGGPYIMVEPGNQTVVEGQRVNFPCGTEGYPSTIVYTWFKDGVDIRTTDGFKVGRLSIQNDGSLLVKPAVKTDTGWYTCRPSNGLGHAEASAYLDVVYKPVVLAMPSQLVWAKGYNQQIDCPADANPKITSAIWVKDQDQIHSRGRFDILSNGTLLVSNVSESDAGNYRCTPQNTLGQGIGSPRVQVLVRDPPQITVSPQTFYIRNVGDSVEMRCEATGTPAVSIQWMKVGGKIDANSDRITITDKFLEIRDLTKEDHGKYECRAINTIATVVTVTELRIHNTTPHAPYNVTVVPGLFNVTISWEPAYDGGTPQFYVLWFRQVGQSDWITMSVPGEAVTYFNLYSLQPDTEYEFKILSRNSFGNGSFSDVVRQRTLGYDPDAVNHLPFDKDGMPFYPDVRENIGPQPSAPLNLTAEVKDRDIHLVWNVPRTSPVPIFSYMIEYQYNNRWQSYDRRITGNTTSTATMMDMPSGIYVIRLRSYGVLAYSPISNVIRVNVPEVANKPAGNADASSSSDDMVLPQALVGGIIGGVLFLLVAVLLALVAIFHSKKKDRKAKEKNKYNDVGYGKPDEMNGRQHEPAPKWDRWQHNGRGDIVTSLNNTDSIFFIPQPRSHDQSANMRPSLLIENRDDRDQLYGRGVASGKGFDPDYGHQVPLTHESSFMSDRSQAGSFRSRPEPARLDARNLTWPNQQRDTSFEQPPAPLHTSLPPGYGLVPGSHVPSRDYPPSHQPPQHSYPPQDHQPLTKSYSFPSRHPSNAEQFPSLRSQHPSHSTHLPLSPYHQHPSQQGRPHPSYSSSHPSTPRDATIPPSATNIPPSVPEDTQYPSFQSEDDDVFGSQPPQPGHRQPPGFPRHSSMKPSQTTYLTDDNLDQHPDTLFGLEDISSVLDPASEQPSQTHPNLSQSLSPSSHPLYRSNNDDSTNIPGYYVNSGDNTKPLAMVTPSQKERRPQSDNESSLSSGRPLGYTRDHLQGVVQRLRDAPRARSLGPPSQPQNVSGYSDPFPQSRANLQSYPPQFSQSHSNLRVPEPYGTLDSRGSTDDSSLQRRKAPYYMSDIMDDPYYTDEPQRPRAHSEGSRGMRGPPYYGDDDYGAGRDYPVGSRPPYGAASYPDMSLPRSDRSRDYPYGDQRAPAQAYDSSSIPRDPRLQPHDYHNQPYHHPHQQQPQSSSSFTRDRDTAPFHQRGFEPQPPTAQAFDPRDALPARYTSQEPGYADTSGRYRDPPSRRYGDETMPADSGSHSSGIGSRNTSQSTGSYHPHRRGSTGKGSMSFSSQMDPDMSLDISGGMPSHRRDTSADENYEFDSLNALENDIMDDLRRYSRLSGNAGSQRGPGSAHSSGGNVHQDTSYPQPSKPSRYPNSEQRFERLREEFKQYRQQQHPAAEIPPPPTAASALPIGLNGEPLYPMDSEML